MFKWLLSTFMIAGSLTASALTASGEEDAIMIEDAWAKVSFKNGAVYMNIQNGDTYATELVKATSPIADRVELHNVIEQDGVFKMIHLDKEGIKVPAGEMVALMPNGYHVMIFGLKEKLKAGDKLPLKLYFYGGTPERNATKEINVIVKPITHKMNHHKHDGHDHHDH